MSGTEKRLFSSVLDIQRLSSESLSDFLSVTQLMRKTIWAGTRALRDSVPPCFPGQATHPANVCSVFWGCRENMGIMLRLSSPREEHTLVQPNHCWVWGAGSQRCVLKAPGLRDHRRDGQTEECQAVTAQGGRCCHQGKHRGCSAQEGPSLSEETQLGF